MVMLSISKFHVIGNVSPVLSCSRSRTSLTNSIAKSIMIIRTMRRAGKNASENPAIRKIGSDTIQPASQTPCSSCFPPAVQASISKSACPEELKCSSQSASIIPIFETKDTMQQEVYKARSVKTNYLSSESTKAKENNVSSDIKPKHKEKGNGFLMRMLDRSEKSSSQDNFDFSDTNEAKVVRETKTSSERYFNVNQVTQEDLKGLDQDEQDAMNDSRVLMCNNNEGHSLNKHLVFAYENDTLGISATSSRFIVDQSTGEMVETINISSPEEGNIKGEAKAQNIASRTTSIVGLNVQDPKPHQVADMNKDILRNSRKGAAIVRANEVKQKRDSSFKEKEKDIDID